MSTPTTTSPPSTTPPRALAPDLARGLMLALIALANVPWFLYGSPVSEVYAHQTSVTGLDAVWQTISLVAIDARSYPLFAFLFGYGIWQLYSRQLERGTGERDARRLLQRRHRWMIVFGAVHAALLWFGDVIGAYGLVGLVVVALFLRRSDKTLLVWAAVLTGILALAASFVLVAGVMIPPEEAAAFADSSPSPSAIASYPASVLPRLLYWAPIAIVQGLVGLAVPIAVLLAIVCARRRVLEDPARHRTLLVRTAAVGIPLGWAGAVPTVLVHHGVWDVPSWSASVLHVVTGLAAALGYAAAFGLVAARAARAATPGRLTRALAAVGQRSLSCYLFQSVVFAPLLSAWGLGLGATLGPWQAALLALATWALSLVLAGVLDRAGVRGPAEWALRRLAYRPRRRPAVTGSA